MLLQISSFNTDSIAIHKHWLEIERRKQECEQVKQLNVLFICSRFRLSLGSYSLHQNVIAYITLKNYPVTENDGRFVFTLIDDSFNHFDLSWPQIVISIVDTVLCHLTERYNTIPAVSSNTRPLSLLHDEKNNSHHLTIPFFKPSAL